MQIGTYQCCPTEEVSLTLRTSCFPLSNNGKSHLFPRTGVRVQKSCNVAPKSIPRASLQRCWLVAAVLTDINSREKNRRLIVCYSSIWNRWALRCTTTELPSRVVGILSLAESLFLVFYCSFIQKDLVKQSRLASHFSILPSRCRFFPSPLTVPLWSADQLPN